MSRCAADGSVDYHDAGKTENARVSYPLHHIANIVSPSRGGHARKVIFLSADAFGVLPPVARLSEEQAEYYFLSGFTAKLAGTERGVDRPVPVFSACFGAAFLSLHPRRYGRELMKKMRAAGARAYLVNTGWNGAGERISIAATRAIIRAVLEGELDNADCVALPHFRLEIPRALGGVDAQILDPRNSFASRRNGANAPRTGRAVRGKLQAIRRSRTQPGRGRAVGRLIISARPNTQATSDRCCRRR